MSLKPHRRLLILLGLLAVSIVLFAFIAGPPRSTPRKEPLEWPGIPHFRTIGVNDVPVRDFATYVTWAGYEGSDKDFSENAVYNVSGETVGKGTAGFQMVMARLSHLPNGSKVLIYPYYGTLEVSRSGIERHDPWMNWYSEVARIAADKNLSILLSVYDHHGRLDEVVKRDIESAKTVGLRPGRE